MFQNKEEENNEWISQLSTEELKDHQNFVVQEMEWEAETQYYLTNDYDRSDIINEYDKPEREYVTNNKILPRTPHTTMEFIDWSRVITKNNVEPLKFSASKEAVTYAAGRSENIQIDRVAFQSSTSWVIFQNDRYLGTDQCLHPYKRDIDSWKLHIISGTTFDTHHSNIYCWNIKAAMSRIPEAANPMNPPLHQNKPVNSMEIVSNSGNLMFHRIFH